MKLAMRTRDLDYKCLGLEDNPFPYSGVPDNEPKLYFNQKNLLNAIDRVLSAFMATHKSRHLVITGTYGNGKSHTLKYIKSELKRRLSGDNPRICHSYVAQMGETFLDMYREILYDLGFDFLRELSSRFIGQVAHELYREGKLPEKVQKGRGWEMITKGEILISDVIPSTIEKLNTLVKFTDFSKAFVNLSYETHSLGAWEWISGEGTDYPRRKDMNLTSNLQLRHAIRAFMALQKVLLTTGYDGLILLIDEFEAIELLNALAKQKLLHELRHMIDLNPRGFCMVIACAPEVWSSLVSEYHAFSERISMSLNLRPLDRHSLPRLVRAYLTNGGNTPRSATPFTKGALNEILLLSHGNYRRAISLCAGLVDIAAHRSRRRIDTGLVKEFADSLD